jgi:hypothetical protein
METYYPHPTGTKRIGISDLSGWEVGDKKRARLGEGVGGASCYFKSAQSFDPLQSHDQSFGNLSQAWGNSPVPQDVWMSDVYASEDQAVGLCLGHDSQFTKPLIELVCFGMVWRTSHLCQVDSDGS